MTGRVTAILAMAWILQACAGPSRMTTETNDLARIVTAESVIDQIVLPEPPAALTATADLSIESPLYSGGATAHLKHRLGDSILVSFTVRGLGIEAARLLVTADSFFLYNRIEKELTVGTSTTDLLPDMFSPKDAMHRMLGLIKPDDQVDWEHVETGDGSVLHNSESGEQWIVDLSLGRVVSYERSLPSGQLAEALYFAEFEAVGSEQYPKRVTYRSPLMATSGLLQFRSVNFTEDIPEMTLVVPTDVKRIIVE